MGRVLPWRIRPEDRARGMIAEPYAVWLSEIMLQQTTVTHAAPYWQRFLSSFPTVTDLGNAPRDQIMSMWAGLGYYARARNLYKCAQLIRDEYDGVFPRTEAELLKLPGIGPYTAAAIAGICFNAPSVVVDGNVERVISRMACVSAPLPKGKKDIKLIAGQLADPVRSGDYSQALMDLGSTICSPKNPKCELCVWASLCGAHKLGDEEKYPKKLAKKALPKRVGNVFILRSEDGYVLLEQRPDKGLLGGMLAFPGGAWAKKPTHKTIGADGKGLNGYPKPELQNLFQEILEGPFSSLIDADQWTKSPDLVQHVFTHFELTLSVYSACVARRDILDKFAADAERKQFLVVKNGLIDDIGLPSVMQKVWGVGGKHL